MQKVSKFGVFIKILNMSVIKLTQEKMCILWHLKYISKINNIRIRINKMTKFK